jgi:hypothetical protein
VAEGQDRVAVVLGQRDRDRRGTRGYRPGTVVRFTLDPQPTGLLKLTSPMIAGEIRRELASLETLKKLLEQAVPQ